MAPPIATDPVIPVCLFPAVLHFSKPTKRKGERVRNRFVKGKLTVKRESLREKESQETMAATSAVVLPRVFFLCYRLAKTSKLSYVHITCIINNYS